MSDALKEGALGSKDYEIKKLELINSSGQVLDLRKVFVELQIFQDLYSSVMNGNIVINDGNDLFNSFSLCGNEYLRISIDKPSLGLPLEKIFRIYKTTDRSPTKDSSHAQVYILHFCSDEMILSNSSRISKAYRSQTAGQIVMDVLMNHLKVDKSRINSFEDTSGTFDFVVPWYRPFEVIQWAVSRSYDLNPKFCYFFYESSFGYSFQSLQTLYKQKPYKKLKFDIKNVDNPDIATNKDSIDKFKILNDFDILTSVSNGSYASRLLAVDIFSQTFKDYTYSLAGSEKNLLNKYKQLNSAVNATGNTAFDSYDSYATAYIEINDTKSEKENSLDKWMIPRALHMTAINSFKFSATLPGDIALKVGDIVEYEFPKFVAPDESGKEGDEYRTAKYLVTAVNHKFREDIFESIVEFSSDSYAASLPAAADLTKILAKKN